MNATSFSDCVCCGGGNSTNGDYQENTGLVCKSPQDSISGTFFEWNVEVTCIIEICRVLTWYQGADFLKRKNDCKQLNNDRDLCMAQPECHFNEKDGACDPALGRCLRSVGYNPDCKCVQCPTCGSTGPPCAFCSGNSSIMARNNYYLSTVRYSLHHEYLLLTRSFFHSLIVRIVRTTKLLPLPLV